jgi:hypothetical protein
MKINVEKNKVMKISKEPSPVEIMIYQKQLESVEYFNCLFSMITNHAGCTRGIKPRIVMTKAELNEMELFSPTNWN